MKALCLSMVLVFVAVAKAAKTPDPDLGVAILVFDKECIEDLIKGPDIRVEVPLVDGKPVFEHSQVVGARVKLTSPSCGHYEKRKTITLTTPPNKSQNGE